MMGSGWAVDVASGQWGGASRQGAPVIEQPLRLRVGGEEDLESSVQEITIDFVGADPPSHSV
jgi:hypothetical protein